MLSNMLLREARLRSGLTQQDLADRAGVQANVISRWELGRVALGFDRLAGLVAACGLELSVSLRTAEDGHASLMAGYLGLSPRERLAQLGAGARQDAELFGEQRPPFDPLTMLQALRRAEVEFIVVGGVAATLHGGPFPTYGLDVTPRPGDGNGARLSDALGALGVERTERGADGARHHQTRVGGLAVVPRPAGTRGHGDLSRSAAEMDVGVKVWVASLPDVIRSADALARPERRGEVMTLRRLATEVLGVA